MPGTQETLSKYLFIIIIIMLPLFAVTTAVVWTVMVSPGLLHGLLPVFLLPGFLLPTHFSH